MSYVDPDRIQRLRNAMRDAGLDALLCSAPQNVLMLSQYWPVVGSSFALLTSDTVALVVPEDEQELAKESSADEVHTFKAASLERLTTADEEAWPVLAKAVRQIGGVSGKIGTEINRYFTPPAYVSLHRYGLSSADKLRATFPQAKLTAADDLLSRAGAVKTGYELDQMRKGCEVAGNAFLHGKASLIAGMSERDAAQSFQATLFTSRQNEPDARCGGQAWCMSGPNSAAAYKAYARTRGRKLENDDLVLVHCNSHYNGMWTDITRTFSFAGASSERHDQLYDAIFRARDAAFAAIRPGARASEVDRAARNEMQSAGLGDAFKHQTGHGVGFEAINHNAYPRIHPASDDILEEGMTFNVEPAAYFEGVGGLRHCELIAVTRDGYEVLSSFLDSREHLKVPAR